MNINKKGFSLVELMIVVAIIGVLTAIAIPNFQAFQARSRQSAAKSALTGIYTAAQTFHSKWEVYAGSLPVIGYVPTGDYRYLVGFHMDLNKFCGSVVIMNNGTTAIGCGPAPQRTFTPTPDTALANSISCANVKEACPAGSSYKGATGLDGTTHWAKSTDGSGSVTGVQATTGVGPNDFFAAAIGDPRGFGSIATDVDLWGIDEKKKLDNTAAGKYATDL